MLPADLTQVRRMFYCGQYNRRRNRDRKQFTLTTDHEEEGGRVDHELRRSDPTLPWGSRWRRRILSDILVLALPAGIILACSCSWVPKIFPPLGVGRVVVKTCRYPSEREVSLTASRS